MAPFPNFIGPTYQSASPLVDAEECINWYPEATESAGAATTLALYPTPGLVAWGAGSVESPGRGMYAADGRAFAVQGQTFYELNVDTSLTNRGGLARDGNPATISSSGDAGQLLLVVSAGNVYSFNTVTNTLSPAVGGLTAQQGGYLDGRFLALEQGQSMLHVSGLLDPTTWTQFDQRSTAPDRWRALQVAPPYIWLFGSQTTDVFYDSQVAPQPFAPVPGVQIPYGIAADWSAVVIDGLPIWLSQQGAGQAVVVRANGLGVPQRISTHAMEFALQAYPTIADAQGFAYQQQGHTFYVLTFPTAGVTWVYDLSTGMWHKRLYLNPGTGQFEAWRPTAHCYAFGQHLVSDRATGAIYSLNQNTFTDNGVAIRRVRRAPYVTQRYTQNYFGDFQVLMQVGVGAQVGQGVNPLLMFRFAADGIAWGNERQAVIGKAGKYATRVRYTRVGRARGNPLFEISLTDPIFAAIYAADLDMAPGVH